MDKSKLIRARGLLRQAETLLQVACDECMHGSGGECPGVGCEVLAAVTRIKGTIAYLSDRIGLLTLPPVVAQGDGVNGIGGGGTARESASVPVGLVAGRSDL